MFGRLIKAIKEKNEIQFQFQYGRGILTIINPYVINVFSPIKNENRNSYAVENIYYETCKIEVEKLKEYVEVRTEELIIKIYDEFKIDIYDQNRKALCEDYRGNREPFIRRGNEKKLEEEGHKALESIKVSELEVIKKLDGNEKFYGLGDKTGHLNKRGYEYIMWNTDDPSPHVESHKALYKSVPFFITLKNNDAFGIFFDNTYKSYFDMGKENEKYYYFSAEEGNLNYYFIKGPKIKEVITRYTALTGRTPLPQRWTLGYQQSRWSYENKDRVLEIAEKFRKNHIPIDAIHLDIDYMDGYRIFTIDKGKFPDFKEMIAKLKNMGIKIVTIIDPGIKKDRGYKIYDEAIKNGYCLRDKDGLTYINEVWPGDSVYPDFSNEIVRGWWGENQKIMLEEGVQGIWNDMNEPASFNGPLPDDVLFDNDGKEANHREFHNLYGHLMAKATFKGIKKHSEKRPFVISRACFAGSQKYTTVWTGDNQSSWEHLRLSIPMLLNLGISGMSFCGCDIGGFSNDCNKELLCRWIEAGCFSALFRNHSAMFTRDQEPWTFDEKTLNINKKYINLRYKLLPYIYDLMYKGEKDGLPLIRPLVLHYSEDKNVHDLNDEFLLGENILVAPVVEQGKNYRAIYVPEGSWIDYWTKKEVKGGKVILKDAPIDICPMYIKKGAIIPNWPIQNYIGENKIEELTLDIYLGNGRYEHYEDDGESYKYRVGEYNLYEIIQLEEENLVNIKIVKKHRGYSSRYKTIKILFNSLGIKKITFNGKNLEFEEKQNKICFTIDANEGEIKLHF